MNQYWQLLTEAHTLFRCLQFSPSPLSATRCHLECHITFSHQICLGSIKTVTLLDFPSFGWPWHFGEIWSGIFVNCPSIWVCLMSFFWFDRDFSLEEEDKVPFLPDHIKDTLSAWLTTDDVSLLYCYALSILYSKKVIKPSVESYVLPPQGGSVHINFFFFFKFHGCVLSLLSTCLPNHYISMDLY